MYHGNWQWCSNLMRSTEAREAAYDEELALMDKEIAAEHAIRVRDTKNLTAIFAETEPKIFRNSSQISDWRAWDLRRTKALYPNSWHMSPVHYELGEVKRQPMIYADIDTESLHGQNMSFVTRRRRARKEDFDAGWESDTELPLIA